MAKPEQKEAPFADPIERDSERKSAFDDWLTFEHINLLLLAIINLVLALKSISYLLAFWEDSNELIAEFNGLLLFNKTFKWATIALNLLVFACSISCLITISMPIASRHKRRIYRCYAASQVMLVLMVLLAMVSLWHAPVSLRMDQRDWQERIESYTYDRFSRDTSGNLPDSADIAGEHTIVQDRARIDYVYLSPIDRIQQALGCCGYSEPADWSRFNQRKGLLAPSCCSNPLSISSPTTIIVDSADDRRHSAKVRHIRNSWNATRSISTLERIGRSQTSSGRARSLGSELDNRRSIQLGLPIFYCPAATTISSARSRAVTAEVDESASLNRVNRIGCQRLLDGRETKFVFGVRLRLLLLLSLALLNILHSQLVANGESGATRDSGAQAQPRLWQA